MSGHRLLLDVTDATASAHFDALVLERQLMDAGPTFAMFVLPSGLGLGLWGKNGVVSAPSASGGG